MKQRRQFIFLFLLLIGYVTFGQTYSISELYNKINELEKRIRSLEIIINSNTYEASQEKYADLYKSKTNWRKLEVGMKEDEVRKILGEPLHIQRLGSSLLYWEYSSESWHSNVKFDNRGVTGWVEPED